MRPTWEFVFAALYPKTETGQLVQLAHEGIDEEVLLSICRDHGILLIVNESLKEVAQQIFSATGLEAWRATVAASTLHSLEMYRELQRLTSFFDQAGLPVAPFKGPQLSESLYGDPLLRMSADLDFLVPREHVARVVDLLIDHGYVTQFDRISLDRWLKPNARYFHCGMVPEHRKWLIEIHWLVFAGWRRAHFPKPDGSESFPGGVGDVIETLLYLCNHGAHHWWIELKWIVDVERCVRSAQDLAWEELFARAADRGCLRIVCLALQLARQVCGLELPVAVAETIDKDPKVTALARRVAWNWPRPKNDRLSLTWKARYLLDCRERFSDQLGMIFNYPLLRTLSAQAKKRNH